MAIRATARRSDHVKLDMRRYWEANEANYLGRVSKERILEAVREAVTPEAGDNLSKLKKQAMAEAATQRLAGKCWLPSLLREPQVTTMAEEPLPLAAE